MNRPDPSPSVQPAPRQPAERLALIGHDLRAAVSDIIGGIRLIDQSGLDDATRLQLERIRTSGEVLARLLEEGLELMHGESSAGPAAPANVQMSRFLYDLEMRWSGRAREKGLGFRLATSPEVPQVIATDRVALDRVLANLLSNAVKYTDRGAVELGIERAGDGGLRFVVTDSGPGFSAAALDRLFQYAGRPDGTGKPGQGLGMFISNDLAGRLGWRISVTNLTEGGAEVALELPQGSWTPAAAPGPVELPDLTRVKVLVAEDSPTGQSILSAMLGRMGAEFRVAADGVEALHWLEREAFDIALIDIEMPRLSGLEVIRAIRANERVHTQMPVIAVTAYIRRADRETIYAAGADSILSKPLPGIEMVGHALAAALERFATSQVEAAEPGEGLPDLDPSQLEHLLEISGPEASRELMDRLCSDLSRCRDGLCRAIESDDRAAMRAETHVLIALAGAIGANRLRKLAEALNLSAHRRQDAGRGSLAENCVEQVAHLIGFVAGERARREGS
ncbi:MAG: response regulator [Pseudomonadota bacterium]